VTNFGTKAIDVSATLTMRAVATSTIDTCADGPLAVGASCRVSFALGQSGFATVESSSGKVRAAINVVVPGANNSLVAVVPATK
jgi:hypothetical protein